MPNWVETLCFLAQVADYKHFNLNERTGISRAKKSKLLSESFIMYLPNHLSKQIGQQDRLLNSLVSHKTIKAEIQSKKQWSIVCCNSKSNSKSNYNSSMFPCPKTLCYMYILSAGAIYSRKT